MSLSYLHLPALVQIVLDGGKKLCHEHGKTGGHFCLANEVGEPVLILLVEHGSHNLARAARTLEFCQEKIARLLMHRNHLASSQSRDPEAKQYGGAIRVLGGYMSFSGLPEEFDEVLCMAVALAVGAVNTQDVIDLQEATGNMHSLRL